MHAAAARSIEGGRAHLSAEVQVEGKHTAQTAERTRHVLCSARNVEPL